MSCLASSFLPTSTSFSGADVVMKSASVSPSSLGTSSALRNSASIGRRERVSHSNSSVAAVVAIGLSVIPRHSRLHQSSLRFFVEVWLASRLVGILASRSTFFMPSEVSSWKMVLVFFSPSLRQISSGDMARIQYPKRAIFNAAFVAGPGGPFRPGRPRPALPSP